MSIVGIGDTVADGGGGSGFAEFTQRFSNVAAAAISSLPAAAAAVVAVLPSLFFIGFLPPSLPPLEDGICMQV